ncbi:expressed unknown protein [Seminavis robusta]|uniref:Uncharacterized protein n=1 Tax=Seminavis robusta TaxID=568900 RepID=A0A9N8EVH9_9STRA|nr:expressed unknown protein [Seminavis robusta]|eukprot:Sro2102_g314660.1 n/a (105) ;mRNA; r:17801-18115
MKGKQFPIISNSATTGHNYRDILQCGYWYNSWRYCQNWAYVVLSRVRTMSGLFLLKKLDWDPKNFAMPQRMRDMLARFKDTIGLSVLGEDQYDEMFQREDGFLL